MRPGARLGRYEVLGAIGTGEVAHVVLVRHLALDALYALKLVDPGSAAQRERFAAAVRRQAAIRHQHLVQVEDLVEVEGAPGLVVEYVEGPTLDRLLEGRRLDPAQADHLARGVLAGVAEAHARGLVHGDLKPRSVIVELAPGGPVPKVGDLGLAEVVTAAAPAAALVGLPAYRAPEVLAGAPPDQRADVYALGAVLYELVTGQRPHPQASIAALHAAALAEDHPPVSSRVPQLPAAQAAAIEDALSADPARRPPDAGALLARWSRVPAQVATWPPLDALRPPRPGAGFDPLSADDLPSGAVVLPPTAASPPAPRWRAPAAAALLLLLLLAAALLVYL